MKKISFIILLFVPAFITFAGPGSDVLLADLERAIANEPEYIARKEIYLEKQKQQLSAASARPEDRIFLYLALAREYEVYRCDSSISYSVRALETARSIGSKTLLDDATIQWARSEAKAGLFWRADDILATIDTAGMSPRQLIDYYKAHIESCVYAIEYQDGYELAELIDRKRRYQDSLLEIADPDSYDYISTLVLKYYDLADFGTAQRVLLDYLPGVKPGTREFAGLTSLLSHTFHETGDVGKQKQYLIISAIADIQECIKENISLRVLAELLFAEGDVARANRYIKKSLEDANFYNARLRNIQTSKVFPIIDEAYQMDREEQRSKLKALLLMVSVLSAILLGAIAFVITQIKRLAVAKKYIEQTNTRLEQLNADLQRANEKQTRTNMRLAESNHIKELFIGNFLEICTQYIDKLRAFKLLVNRKTKAGQTADLLRLTSNTEGSPQDLKELYENFDQAFLNIYPTFVEEFNGLLRPEERYAINNDGSLNHELRIFALIKLGIKDTAKIGLFLNYAPRTVYNYRSKVKSKALDPERDLEEMVKKIGTPEI